MMDQSTLNQSTSLKSQKSAFIFEIPSGGDISLRSTDGSIFRVHSVILGLASSVFSDMFSVGTQSSEVVDLADDSESISLMLAFIYPSSLSPAVNTFELLEKCLLVSQKYDVKVIPKVLDRDLYFKNSGNNLIDRDPLRVFRLAVTHGLRTTQTLAAKYVMPLQLELRVPEEVVKLAKEHPSAAYAIGLVGAQAARAKILFQILFCLENDDILPIYERGEGRMICSNCYEASGCTDGRFSSDGAPRYTPTWMTEWSKMAYPQLTQMPFAQCDWLFGLSILHELELDPQACDKCIQASRDAECYGEPVFPLWTNNAKNLIVRKLMALDCLYSL